MFLDKKVFKNYPIEELIKYIDWTPFFITWQLSGKYPGILEDEKVGKAATELFNDARELLSRLIKENSLQARAVIGFGLQRELELMMLEFLEVKTTNYLATHSISYVSKWSKILHCPVYA